MLSCLSFSSFLGDFGVLPSNPSSGRMRQKSSHIGYLVSLQFHVPSAAANSVSRWYDLRTFLQYLSQIPTPQDGTLMDKRQCDSLHTKPEFDGCRRNVGSLTEIALD